jgi:hypothetical protein
VSEKYWFPAKTYGWGWGFPQTWQGWTVFAAFLGLVFLSILIFPPQRGLMSFIVCTVILSIGFGTICWWKGEPPHWRWGAEKEK